MQALEKRYKIARLIAGELLGTLSESELLELEEWKRHSSGNTGEYLKIRNRLQGDINKNSDFDLTHEWSLFERRLHRKKYIFRNWYAVAAASVIIGLTVTLLWMKWAVTEPVTVDVLGGTKGFRATLVLGNGEQVNIADSLSRTIAVDKGVKIATQGNVMKYDVLGGDKDVKVEWNTIIVPRGGEYELILADGTRVWLNSESRLTYPVRFSGARREVSMTGEICFDVARNEQCPFVVKTAELEVKVLGTLFNMEAYPEDNRVVTTLVKGKVEVSAGAHTQVLCPNQQLLVNAGEFTLKQVVAEDYIGWTGGLFHFTEASLEEIMTKLARWYDVEFFFTNPVLKEAHFSLDIRRYEKIGAILSKLGKTGRAQFQINGKTVVIEE